MPVITMPGICIPVSFTTHKVDIALAVISCITVFFLLQQFVRSYQVCCLPSMKMTRALSPHPTFHMMADRYVCFFQYFLYMLMCLAVLCCVSSVCLSHCHVDNVSVVWHCWLSLMIVLEFMFGYILVYFKCFRCF